MPSPGRRWRSVAGSDVDIASKVSVESQKENRPDLVDSHIFYYLRTYYLIAYYDIVRYT